MGHQQQQPHILMLPFPLLGHIKPMLSIAQLLCHSGLHVTILNTEHNHCLLPQLQELSTHFPTFHFESISGGLPKDHPRTFDLTKDMVISFKSVTKPLFREMLVGYSRNSDLGPVTCVILDGIMYSFANDVAEELGIRIITTRSYGACQWQLHLYVRVVSGLPSLAKFFFLYTKTQKKKKKKFKLIYSITTLT